MNNFSERINNILNFNNKYVIKVSPNNKYLNWQIHFKTPGYIHYTNNDKTAFIVVSDKMMLLS